MSSTTTYHRDDEFGEVAYIGVEVFDGDDDGDLDLAVFDYYESAGLGGARLWVNDGTGAVVVGPFVGPGGFGRELAAGDVDGDGADDLVVADENAIGVSVGNGTAPATEVDLPDSGGWAVDVADVDGDVRRRRARRPVTLPPRRAAGRGRGGVPGDRLGHVRSPDLRAHR